VERVYEVSKEKDVTQAQIALSWLFHKGITAPIVGATKVEYIEDAVASLDVKLNENEINFLEEVYQPRKIMGFI
jgi:aryl-alcohol dehydrogenase-like predicted oxidoreductase